MESDLTDLRYLYQYGEYITENEKGTARFLNTFSQEEIDAMARTYTEGFRKCFLVARKDLSKKKTVSIRFHTPCGNITVPRDGTRAGDFPRCAENVGCRCVCE